MKTAMLIAAMFIATPALAVTNPARVELRDQQQAERKELSAKQKADRAALTAKLKAEADAQKAAKAEAKKSTPKK
jgi:hypothetical protein